MHSISVYIIKESEDKIAHLYEHAKGPQGFLIVPETKLLEDIREDISSKNDLAPDNIPISVIGKYLSKGRVIHAWTDYFGGPGEQGATLWDPEMDHSFPFIEDNAINKALYATGFKKDKGLDEFDTLGLGKYRTNNDFFAKTDMIHPGTREATYKKGERVIFSSDKFAKAGGVVLEHGIDLIDADLLEEGGSSFSEWEKITYTRIMTEEEEESRNIR